MAYANSADPDQTAPKGAVWSGATVCNSTMYFKKQLFEKQKLDQKGMEWSVGNFLSFPVYTGLKMHI